MSLDLGALVAHATIETTAFDRGTARIMRVLSTFGTEADKASSGVRVLDDSLVAAGGAADKASTSIGRATQATRAQGAAAERAAAQEKQQAAAQAQVNRLLAQYAAEGPRVQQAALRVAAAQERVNQLQEAGVATTRQLASAQATLIGAQRSLAAAQAAGAVSGGRFRSSLAGIGRTAGELGLLIGAIEGVKKAIDITHESASFDAALTRIQTQAGATADEIGQARGALLSMAGRVAQSPEDLAVSLYHVYSATKALGYTLPQMLRAVEIAGKGATVSAADLEETTNALTATMVSGLGSVNNMGKAMGALNAIVGQGDMKLEDLNKALGTGILAAVKVYGVTLSQAGAALDVFGDNNIRGSDAATKLRMSIQDLSKPAATAAETLGKIGLTTTDLRDDLEKGGLTLALHHLKDALDQAGVTGDRVGGFLQDAFTKKAGVGLAILLNNLDQFDEKQQQITQQAGGFGTAWQRTTQTAKFAFSSLGKQAEAAGIKIASKVLPAASQAATWLGTNLPHAISSLAHILGPTVHLVGTGLGDAWHVVAAVLHVVMGALSGVSHFLSDNRTEVTAVTTGVLAMWAAFKLVTIATAAIRGISSLLVTLRLRAMMAGDSMRSMSAGSGVAATAIVALGAVVTGLTMEWEEQKRVAAETAAAVDQYTQALIADNGAIAAHTRAQAIQNLQTAGAYDLARKLGISQGTLTDAALGSADALRAVADATRLGGDTGVKLNIALAEQVSLLHDGIKARRNIVAAENAHKAAASRTSDAVSHLAGGLQNQAVASGNAARASKANTTATRQEKGALAGLDVTIQQVTAHYLKMRNAALGIAQSQAQFLDSIHSMKQALDESNGSLNLQSVKGRAASEALYSAAQGALAMDDGTRKGNASLLEHITNLRAAAIAAGGDKGEVDKLLGSLNLLPRQINMRLNVDTGATLQQLQAIQTQINNMHGRTLFVGVAGGHTLPGSAGGRAQVPEGVSAVGERGTELLVKDGSRLAVVPHGRAMNFLRATGARIQGFAGGTTPTPAELRQQARDQLRGGRHVVGGVRSLGRLLADMTSTRSDFASVFGSIYSALRDAGATHQFVTGLKKQDDAILNAVTRRAKAAKRLANANQDLHDAQHKLKTDRRAFGGAVVGSFDITTAGQNADGRVTRGGILASSAQAVTRARAYVKGMKRLIGMHILGPGYLRELLNAGPSALPEVQALAGMPRADIVKLAQENRQLNKLGNQIGSLGAKRLDQHGIDVAQRQVNHWERIERERDRKLEKLTHEQTIAIVEALEHLHLVGKLGLTNGQLALLVDTGHNQNAKANRTANR